MCPDPEISDLNDCESFGFEFPEVHVCLTSRGRSGLVFSSSYLLKDQGSCGLEIQSSCIPEEWTLIPSLWMFMDQGRSELDIQVYVFLRIRGGADLESKIHVCVRVRIDVDSNPQFMYV